MKGTPIGYTHNWNYNQRGQDNGRRFTFSQFKTKTRKTFKMGGFKRGSKIIWNWNGYERIVPIGNGRYKHIINAYKTQGAYKIRGRKRWVISGKRR